MLTSHCRKELKVQRLMRKIGLDYSVFSHLLIVTQHASCRTAGDRIHADVFIECRLER